MKDSVRAYKRRRFQRRLSGWANWTIMLPRWFYVLLLFFSGWGIASIGKDIVEALG